MRSLPVALTCLSLVLGAASVRADAGVPAKYRPMVQKGLKWLVEQQNKRDGHWEAAGQGYPITMTALGGMALLCEGSTVREGKYARNIRQARDFLVSRSMPNGMIGNPSIPGEAGRYMYGHGFGLLFLSCVYGEEADTEKRKKLEDLLVRAARFTRDAQTNRGVWGYVSARDVGNFDERSVTITHVHALLLRSGALLAWRRWLRQDVPHLEGGRPPELEEVSRGHLRAPEADAEHRGLLDGQPCRPRLRHLHLRHHHAAGQRRAADLPT